MSTAEPDGDDVVSMQAIGNFMRAGIVKVNKIDQNLKAVLRDHSHSHLFKEGVECEFLKASTGGGWQKGRFRVREVCIRFEFIPDVPDEPEPSPDSSALAPLPEPLNPEQQ